MEWVEWMWRVALSGFKTQPNHWTKRMTITRLATYNTRTCPGTEDPRARRAVYSQNRDGYEVERCGRGGGGSEAWLQQGCCVGTRLGVTVRSWRRMVKVVVSKKTNRLFWFVCVVDTQLALQHSSVQFNLIYFQVRLGSGGPLRCPSLTRLQEPVCSHTFYFEGTELMLAWTLTERAV